MSQSLGEDWIPSPPAEDFSFLDKGLATTFPPIIESEEQAVEEEEPQQLHANEVLEEGQIHEEPQQTPHGIETRTLAK